MSYVGTCYPDLPAAFASLLWVWQHTQGCWYSLVGTPKGAQDYCGYVCSALDMSDSTALHEDNCGVSGNSVGVAGSAVGGNAVLYPGVSENTTGL